MSNLSIKDVPEAWAEALRQRAARNHRSLQGELMSIIEQAATAPRLAAGTSSNLGSTTGSDRFGYPLARRSWTTFEQWAAERRQMYPEPITGFKSGTDIIRADRDAR